MGDLVTHLSEKLGKSLSALSELDAREMLSEQVTGINLLLTQQAFGIQKLLHIVNSAIHGQAHPSLMTHQQYVEHLREIQLTLPIGSNLPFPRLESTNTWLYVSVSENVAIKCANEDPHNIILNGTGQLTLNPQCVLYAKQTILFLSQTIVRNSSQNLYNPIQSEGLGSLSVTNISQDLFESLNFSESHYSIGLEDLSRHSKSLKEIEELIKVEKNTNYVPKENVDNNICEQFNSIINKHIAGKRINFALKNSYNARVEAAVVSFNTSGQYIRSIHKKITKKSPGIIGKQFLKARESKLSSLQKRRLNFKKEKYTAKRKKNVGPDEHYGLAEPLDDNETPGDIDEKKNNFVKSLSISSEAIDKLERDTIDQSNSQTWQVERRIRLTASNFGRVCKMRLTTSCKGTVYDLLYGNVTTKAMEYGKMMEDIARKKFETLTNFKVLNCGLFIDKDKPYLAASRDGLVGDTALLEIKCPLSIKDTIDIQVAVDNKKIPYITIVDGKMKLKKDSSYYYQVQGQFKITKRKTCNMSLVEEVCVCGKMKALMNSTNWQRHTKSCKKRKSVLSTAKLSTFFKSSRNVSDKDNTDSEQCIFDSIPNDDVIDSNLVNENLDKLCTTCVVSKDIIEVSSVSSTTENVNGSNVESYLNTISTIFESYPNDPALTRHWYRGERGAHLVSILRTTCLFMT
ncbi:hypothetical protein QTP88_028417 [Uroleucon formosanum]